MRLFLLTLILAGAVNASFLRGQSPAPESPGIPAATSPATPTTTVSPATATQTEAPASPAAPAPAPAATAPAQTTTSSEEAAAASTRAADAVVELTKRLSAMEQLLVSQRERELVAQRDHEVTVYRDTNRLITIFGVTFAAIGVIALLAAAYLNFRGLTALQNVTRSRPTLEPPESSSRGMLESGAPVPGMERVQASGQRFQTRMSSLEHRLAELEHIAGREPVANSSGVAFSSESPPVSAELAPSVAPSLDVGPAEPPRRVIPRAALMVHKAQALMNLGKLDDALATLDEAAAIDRTRGEVHLARGQVLEKLGRLGDALIAYEAAVESDATNTGALLMKAGVLNRQERFSEALACYERGLEVSRGAA